MARCGNISHPPLGESRSHRRAARATYQSAVQDIQRDLEKVVPNSHAGALKRAALGQAYASLGEAASAIA